MWRFWRELCFSFFCFYTVWFGYIWLIHESQELVSTYLDNHLFKKAPQLKDLCWIIFGLILMDFLYLLFFVLLQCRNKIFDNKFSAPFSALRSPLSALEYFLVCFVVFFLYFLRTVWFLMKFCRYNPDNTLIAVSLKDLINEGVMRFA